MVERLLVSGRCAAAYTHYHQIRIHMRLIGQFCTVYPIRNGVIGEWVEGDQILSVGEVVEVVLKQGFIIVN